MPNSKRSASIILVIAALMFSLGGLLIKLSGWNGVALNGARSLVAAGVIGGFMLYSAPHTLVPLRRGRITRLQWMGSIAYVGTNLTFALATQMTTAANAVLLQFTSPVWVALLGIWLLREWPRRVDWLALVAVLLGMGLFFGGELSAENLAGNLIAIFSGVTLAFMVIFLRMERDGSPVTVALLGNLLAAVVGLPFIFGEPFTAYEVGVIAMLGIFQLGIPFVLYTMAVKHLPAIETILILTLEPIVNPILVAVFIAEYPTPSALLGGCLVIVAILARTIVVAARPSRHVATTD